MGEKEKVALLADTFSVYSVYNNLRDWVPDPIDDLAVICTMANAYGASGDFEELGRHVANYVHGMWEMMARTQVKMEKTMLDYDDDLALHDLMLWAVFVMFLVFFLWLIWG